MFCHVTNGWFLESIFKPKSAMEPGVDSCKPMSSPVAWKKFWAIAPGDASPFLCTWQVLGTEGGGGGGSTGLALAMVWAAA